MRNNPELPIDALTIERMVVLHLRTIVGLRKGLSQRTIAQHSVVHHIPKCGSPALGTHEYGPCGPH